jgi:hypothetical protein
MRPSEQSRIAPTMPSTLWFRIVGAKSVRTVGSRRDRWVDTRRNHGRRDPQAALQIDATDSPITSEGG